MITLKSQALSGLKWNSVANVSGTVIQLLQVSILTRHLAPEDFGLMAMAMIVFGFSQAFADMGISGAIIQKQEISESQLSTLYWINIFAGFTVFLVVILLAYPIAVFYQEPRLMKILVYVSFSFIIQSFGQQFRILFQKQMNFSLLTKIELTSKIIGLLTSTTLALYGYGLYSLVWSTLSQSVVLSMLLVFYGFKVNRPSLVFRLNDIRQFLSFGAYQMGEKTINYFSANLDTLLIGKFLGMEAVGFYNLAWRLIMYPLIQINPIINRVAFPVYSKLQNNKVALGRYYTISLHCLSLITVPILAFMFFYANEVVAVVYGCKWETTASLLKILSFVGISKAIGNPGGSIILALGRADICFWWNVFWAIFASMGFAISMYLYDDILYFAYTLLLMGIITGWIWHYIIYRLTGVNYYVIFKNLLRVLTAAFVLGYVSTFITRMVDGLFPYSTFVVAFLVCASFYSVYLYFFEGSLIRQIRGAK